MPPAIAETSPAGTACGPRAQPAPPPAPNPALLALLPWAVFAFLLLVSWNRWMEPFVDSGRELMVPRRVALGERLYRDVQWHHGPLAPWAGAAVERLAGRSFAARTALALAIAAAGLEALRRLSARWIGGAGGALAVSLAVALAYFVRPGAWLFPFSFGTAIAIAAMTGALAWLSGPASRAREAAAAACLLAALLARPELGAAGLAAAILDLRRSPSRIPLVAGAPLLVAAAAYAYVSSGIPAAELIADGWLALLRPAEPFKRVYRVFAGFDQPVLRAAQLALSAILLVGAACVVVAGAAVSERMAANRGGTGGPSGRGRFAIAATLAVLAVCGILFELPTSRWAALFDQFPPLVRVVPAVCVLLALARLAARSLRRPAGGRSGTAGCAEISDGALLLAALFSLRVFLAAGYTGPYNAFFLPLSIVVACAALLAAAGRQAKAVGRSLPILVRGSLALFILIHCAGLWRGYRSSGWEALSTPAGTVVLPAFETKTARLVLADLGRRLPPGASLTGFPEAGFFEYALGTASPTRLEQFWPGHLDEAGEKALIRLLSERPPHAVVLINALAVGEGLPAFGKDYSRELGRFVAARFRPAATYGPDASSLASIGDPNFFIQIRVPSATAIPAGGSPRP